MKFHDKLVKLRKERKWSQTALSEQAGVNITYLSRLENGKSQPSGDMLWKIAKALGVSMDYFMDEDAEEATPVTIKDKNLVERLELIDSLEDTDRQTIINVIDSMLTKKRCLIL
ncbi:MAG: helix-turn-helix transcriptional regulator [Pseudomonadota bacterium]